MRVLFVTGHMPEPPVGGGRRREYELLTRLTRDLGHLVTLVVVEDRVHDLSTVPVLGRLCERVLAVSPREGRAVEAVRRLMECERFSIVHVERFLMMRFVPRDAEVPVVLVEQNIEYLVEQDRARLAASPRVLLQVAERVRRQELVAWRRATVCAAVSEDDANSIRTAWPDAQATVVPNGADHGLHVGDDAPVGLPARGPGPLFLFAANFAYFPNADAAEHLLAEIWPAIRERMPAAQLVLAGNSPSSALRQAGEQAGVTITGAIPSMAGLLMASDVVLCPLRIGGGTKLKVLEALQHGRRVVSTSIGVQGLPAEASACVVIADGAVAFAEAAVAAVGSRIPRRPKLPTWDDAVHALAVTYELAVAESTGIREAA